MPPHEQKIEEMKLAIVQYFLKRDTYEAHKTHGTMKQFKVAENRLKALTKN